MCNPVTTAHPDVLLDKGVHQGYEWEVTANRMGYRCGYVRVPQGHPWHGQDYDSVEPYPDVHGGLTFAEPDTDCGKGGEDSAWWLGFDCAHYCDAPDPDLPGYDARMAFGDGSVKTASYVAAECRMPEAGRPGRGSGTRHAGRTGGHPSGTRWAMMDAQSLQEAP